MTLWHQSTPWLQSSGKNFITNSSIFNPLKIISTNYSSKPRYKFLSQCDHCGSRLLPGSPLSDLPTLSQENDPPHHPHHPAPPQCCEDQDEALPWGEQREEDREPGLLVAGPARERDRTEGGKIFPQSLISENFPLRQREGAEILQSDHGEQQ